MKLVCLSGSCGRFLFFQGGKTDRWGLRTLLTLELQECFMSIVIYYLSWSNTI